MPVLEEDQTQYKKLMHGDLKDLDVPKCSNCGRTSSLEADIEQDIWICEHGPKSCGTHTNGTESKWYHPPSDYTEQQIETIESFARYRRYQYGTYEYHITQL